MRKGGPGGINSEGKMRGTKKDIIGIERMKGAMKKGEMVIRRKKTRVQHTNTSYNQGNKRIYEYRMETETTQGKIKRGEREEI